MIIHNVISTFLSSSIPVNNPKIDLTFSTAVIITLSTIFSSVLVAIINNIFQMKMKKHDLNYQNEFNELQLRIKKADYENQDRTKSLDYQNQISLKEMENKYSLKKYQWETYYKTATEIFSNMLTNVGQYLADPSNLTQYEKSISCIYQSFAFADDELYIHLNSLINNLYKLSHPSNKPIKPELSIHNMEDCALYINKILTKSMQE